MFEKIVVVEDDPDQAALQAYALERAGFRATPVGSAAAALATVASERPEVVIVDLDLPDMDGFELCRRLVLITDAWIIAHSAVHREEDDRIRALEEGAHDVCSKSQGYRELIARLRAAIKRRRPLKRLEAVINGTLVVLDMATHTATARGNPLNLTHSEWRVFAYFLQHTGEILAYDYLSNQLFGLDYADTSALKIHVSRLRKKLARACPGPTPLVTIRDAGYRFAPSDNVQPLALLPSN